MIAVMESDGGDVKAGGGFGPARLAGLGRAVLDQVFPPVCLACGGPVGSADGLCAPCWGRLVPISRPYCDVLGLPFSTDLGPGAVSAQAIANPPPFARARSAVLYTDLARQLVSAMKYGDRPEIALFCGRVTAAACHEVLGPDAVLVPVPLHRARQWRRRYNQAAELARVLAKLAKCSVDTDLIERRRPTRQQVGLSARHRARNVAGAFALAPGANQRMAGKRIVLVDDVITTGATVSALAREFARGGVERVDVVSFARVVFGPEGETDMEIALG